VNFNVSYVREIVWDDGLMDKLAVEPTLKRLIQGAIKSQQKHLIDDFVKGKGLGLVMNLFGPPGVGKTLTAEATSEGSVSLVPTFQVLTSCSQHSIDRST
jgi:replication-associated recombination protein RarA